jgi:hypothetical protein
MPKLSDYIPEKNYFALHVGSSGSGKSCATASFGREKEELYYFDCDHRIAGILNHPRSDDWKPYIQYDKIPQNPQGLEFMMNKLSSWQGGKCPFSAVAVSTATTFDDIVGAYSAKYAGDQVPAKDSSGAEARYKLPGRQFWGLQIAAFDELMGLLKGLGRRVIVEAHWQTKYISEKPGQPRTIPAGMSIALREKLAETFPVHFNDVFFFEKASAKIWDKTTLSNIEEVKFEVVTNNELARTTIPGLPSRIDWSGKNFRNLLFGNGE